MLSKLQPFFHRPALYAPGTAKFWDDPHISKGMLEAHLNPTWDAATRNHAFVGRSADWIAGLLPPAQFPRLLDLGCGPGLYAQRFRRRGYRVTGVDLSERSLDYARQSAREAGLSIDYVRQNYLDLDVPGPFDVAVMIYCDYGALSGDNRKQLLANVRKALRPGGCLLLDVFTPRQYEGRKESRKWSYQDAGFWSPEPHLCLESLCRYGDNTFLSQTIVVTEGGAQCYNIWEQVFEAEALRQELASEGFVHARFFGDVAGADAAPDSATLCVVAHNAGEEAAG